MVDMLQNSTSFGRTGFLEAVSDTKQVRMPIPGLITGKFNDGYGGGIRASSAHHCRMHLDAKVCSNTVTAIKPQSRLFAECIQRTIWIRSDAQRELHPNIDVSSHLYNL
jgi:hypothetical protein